jgi:1,4-dihydroxy-6-naphthoate synthase
MSKLQIAFSPCPNDIFIFSAWMKGHVGTHLPIEPMLADIETLNEWAMEKRYPISKVSIGCIPDISDSYQMLDAGAALGYGCGPKIVAKSLFAHAEIEKKRVAIPGKQTTANLLFNLLMPTPASKAIIPYHHIVDRIIDGTVDCGVIIHETRFTFQQRGLFEIADLGTLWEGQYNLPIPLGAIVVSKQLTAEYCREIENTIRESLKYAWRHPEETIAHAAEYSQEKDPGVIRKHIDLYVNAETEQLSERARMSIKRLCEEKSKR